VSWPSVIQLPFVIPSFILSSFSLFARYSLGSHQKLVSLGLLISLLACALPWVYVSIQLLSIYVHHVEWLFWELAVPARSSS
jgi:hypothetical protein